MGKQSLEDLFLSIFAGRSEFYALWYPTSKKGFYVPSNYVAEDEKKQWIQDKVEKAVKDIGAATYDKRAVHAHIYGEHFLGVYPIRSDSKVKFFALDYDKEFDEAWTEAVSQQNVFLKEAGIKTYLEVSRSGKGIHLWGFLDEWVNAGEIRHALSQFIADAVTYDRMFPNQDGVDELLPVGNLIALPLFGPNVKEGRGVFVYADKNGKLQQYSDQEEFLYAVEKIPAAAITAIFQSNPESYEPNKQVQRKEGPAGQLYSSYKMTNKYFGCEFIRWCKDNPNEVSEPAWWALANQFAQFVDGRELFHEWSEGYSGYDPDECDLKFDRAVKINAPNTCSYIREHDLGPGCSCDKKYSKHGVYHPYDLHKVPLSVLIESVEDDIRVREAKEGITEALFRAHEYQNNPTSGKGFAYDIATLDDVTGIRNGEVIAVCSRPGAGKTTFGPIDLGYKLADKGIPAYVFSIEMSFAQLTDKLLSRIAEVDSRRILTGTMTKKDWEAIKEAEKDIRERDYFPFFIDDVTNRSDEILNIAGELIGQHGKGVVFVDYLQLATAEKGEDDRQRTSRVMRQCRLLAKTLEIPVIILVQLSRLADEITKESRVSYSMIAESSQIERDCSVIMFLLATGENESTIDTRLLAVVKERRMGAGARIELQYHKGISRFGDLGTWTAEAKSRHENKPDEGDWVLEETDDDDDSD